MRKQELRLSELISVGPAMLRDFELLGIRSVAQLAKEDPQRMYKKLGRVAEQHQDICVLDVFRAAVAQARNPRLPAEQCAWWCWSRTRKREPEAKRQGIKEARNQGSKARSSESRVQER